ncbi:MAG: hypothetical protein J5613_01600 [Alphaproteobacteria bacterium]|nr:hypothetical protein [Alphaproteobacteria bacterium]
MNKIAKVFAVFSAVAGMCVIPAVADNVPFIGVPPIGAAPGVIPAAVTAASGVIPAAVTTAPGVMRAAVTTAPGVIPAAVTAAATTFSGSNATSGSGGCNWVDWKRGTRDADRDDYLWRNAREYNDAAVRDGTAKAAVCGGVQSGTCWSGAIISAPAEHVFKGQVIPYAQQYKCRAGGRLNHRWEPINEANACPAFRFEGANVTLHKGETYPNQSGVTMTNEECKKITGETLDPHGVKYIVKCNDNWQLQCILRDCSSGYTPQNNRCVQGGGNGGGRQCDILLDGQAIILNVGQEHSVALDAHQCRRARSSLSATTNVEGGGAYDDNAVYHLYCAQTQVCRKVGCKSGYHDQNGTCVRGGGGQSCRERRAGMSEEAKACCDTGSAATWDTPVRGKCTCVDTNTHFEIVSGRGQCVPNGVITTQCPPDAVPSADNTTCICTDQTKTYDPNTRQCVARSTHTCPAHMAWSDSSNQCECVEQYQRKEGDTCVCTVPNAANDANGICKCTEKDHIVKDGKCEFDESVLLRIRGEISATFTQLNSHIGGLEQSVWKDTEGNFNTARLASDSIAGVVLGTAGGLITAKVVKKNQLKQGFEDIKCSIGGQNVASYGDDFNVGM